MWGTPLTILMLVAVLAGVAYIALWAGRLERRLVTLLDEQSDERRRVEQAVARVRATGVPGC